MFAKPFLWIAKNVNQWLKCFPTLSATVKTFQNLCAERHARTWTARELIIIHTPAVGHNQQNGRYPNVHTETEKRDFWGFSGCFSWEKPGFAESTQVFTIQNKLLCVHTQASNSASCLCNFEFLEQTLCKVTRRCTRRIFFILVYHKPQNYIRNLVVWLRCSADLRGLGITASSVHQE